MKVQFKYPRSLNGQHYATGFHEIPDAFADHWFFKALVECKDVVVLEQPKISSSSVPKEEKLEPEEHPKDDQAPAIKEESAEAVEPKKPEDKKPKSKGNR